MDALEAETVEYVMAIAFAMDYFTEEILFWLYGHINWDSPGHISQDKEVRFGDTQLPVMAISMHSDLSTIERKLADSIEMFANRNY